ncbi:hypothetical protein BKA61DRAFT_568701 [Leptodontidium sp. MPI-SDFR-AT-0119]|nr:hypothetical protein BKA61DRAFT_568701 [Leptodontidium sp. MPI-SDFR-AT-0119]
MPPRCIRTPFLLTSIDLHHKHLDLNFGTTTLDRQQLLSLSLVAETGGDHRLDYSFRPTPAPPSSLPSFPTFTYPEVQDHLDSPFQLGAYNPTLSAEYPEDFQDSLVSKSNSCGNTAWDQEEEEERSRLRYIQEEIDRLSSSSSDCLFILDVELLEDTPPSVIRAPTPAKSTPDTNIPIHLPPQNDDVGSSSPESVGRFLCNTCHKHYSHEYKLNQHRRTHIREFKCPHTSCEFHVKGFGTTTHLRKHLDSSAHRQLPAHAIPCPYPGCQKAFSRNDNLLRHFRTKHSL